MEPAAGVWQDHRYDFLESATDSGPDVNDLVVGVLGGTGDQGRGLAYRLARAGQQVMIGSRSAERAKTVADELENGVLGADNHTVAKDCDVVIVAVPWDGHAELLGGLRAELAARSSSTASTRSASTSRAPTRCARRRAAPPSRPPRCCPSPG